MKKIFILFCILSFMLLSACAGEKENASSGNISSENTIVSEKTEIKTDITENEADEIFENQESEETDSSEEEITENKNFDKNNDGWTDGWK